jgi:hypothetical protein
MDMIQRMDMIFSVAKGTVIKNDKCPMVIKNARDAVQWGDMVLPGEPKSTSTKAVGVIFPASFRLATPT